MSLLKKSVRKSATIMIASANPEIDPEELFSGIVAKNEEFTVGVKYFICGSDAYEWCSRNPDEFDFCLVGVDLEDMTGLTLAYQLRRDLAKEVILLVDLPESETSRVRDYTLRAEVVTISPNAMEKIREYARQFKTKGTLCQEKMETGTPRFEQVSRLKPGTIVKDYTLVQPVAVGGMGMVWEAFESGDRSRQIAIKFLAADWKYNARVTEMFRHESRLLSQMTHESLLPVLASGCWNSYEFIVFPFITGSTGEEIFFEAAPLPIEIASHIGAKLLSVLDYVHSFELNSQPLRIQHRDVNPSNLLFSVNGEIFLIDFGGAKSEIQKQTFDGRKLKISVVAQGAAGYEAPEQRENPLHPQNSQLADIYSAGLVIYRMLVSRLYRDDDAYELERLPDVLTVEQCRFFKQILAKCPQDRFQSAQEAKDSFVQLFPVGSEEELRCFIKRII
jgi:hypothetical protein